jgi:hypothetical protein
MQRAIHKLLWVVKVLDINDNLWLVMMIKQNWQYFKQTIDVFNNQCQPIDEDEAKRIRDEKTKKSINPKERLNETLIEVKKMFKIEEPIDDKLAEIAEEQNCTKSQVRV